MNLRFLVIIAGLIGLGVAGSLGWYLASPLFIDNTVEEAFPFEAPGEAELAVMSAEEKQAMEAKLMEAMPTEAEVAALPAEQQAQLEAKIIEAAAKVMSDKTMNEDMADAAAEWLVAGQGRFAGADSFHQGSGQATIFQQGDQRVLRFENFEVTNGPDLHVLLAANPNPTGSSELGEYIDLGSLKGNIGNQNYEIPADVDLSQYQSVVIYCKPFHVVFATATLNN